MHDGQSERDPLGRIIGIPDVVLGTPFLSCAGRMTGISDVTRISAFPGSPADPRQTSAADRRPCRRYPILGPCGVLSVGIQSSESNFLGVSLSSETRRASATQHIRGRFPLSEPNRRPGRARSGLWPRNKCKKDRASGDGILSPPGKQNGNPSSMEVRFENGS
jgi:hypothetical protein